MKRLNGNVAIITGGGSGIGEAAVKLFAAEGARVVVADIQFDHAKTVANAVRAAGGEAHPVQVDVSKRADVEAMLAETQSVYGRLDILYNNAGTILPGLIEDIEETAWQRLLDVNLTSVFLCTKYALPELKKNRGRIINMGSMNGVVGQQRNPAYSATKGAIIAMTRSLAIDVAPFGVRVNAICPAGVLTPLLADWFERQPDPDQMRRDTDFSHMLGRTATPEEIARVALFLASDESSFITGQAIPVEGGATLGYGTGPKAEWVAVDEEIKESLGV